MAERNIEFKEIPNTYKLFTEKTTVLKRNVLIEKVDFSKNDYFLDYFNFEFNALNEHYNQLNNAVYNYRNDLVNIQNRLEESRVLTEKNIRLVHKKREVKERREKNDKNTFFLCQRYKK